MFLAMFLACPVTFLLALATTLGSARLRLLLLVATNKFLEGWRQLVQRLGFQRGADVIEQLLGVLLVEVDRFSFGIELR